jgi:hypothetical protein
MAWAEMVRVYERLHGRDKLTDALNAMPPQWREGLDPRHPTLGILDASWYLEEQRNAFFAAITRDLPLHQKQALSRTLAKAVMEQSLRGLHRMIFAVMATPERFVKHAQSLWNQHHDSGHLRMRMVARNGVEAAVLDWPAHGVFACMTNHYSCLVTLEAMGCRDLTERRVCMAEGASECVGVYYWRER